MIDSSEYKKGFTLIELLTVISIIGLLSSVILTSLNTSRSKARDARRISDIRQIRTALESYYDIHGQYPLSGQCGATIPNSGWSNSVECFSNGRWLRDSTTDLSNFIASDPIDPTNENSWPRNAYYYYSRNYGGEGQWYMLVYSLENSNQGIESSDGVTAPNGTYFHYGNGSNGIITIGTGR